MALPMSSAFTMPDRRKKVVTYGKSARFTAPQTFPDDASSPERPRKQRDMAHGMLRRPAATTGASKALENMCSSRRKSSTPEDIFDVPSDNEPTPRPTLVARARMPPKEPVDEFVFPSSDDDPPRTIRRVGTPAQTLRKPDTVRPPVHRLRQKAHTPGPATEAPSTAPSGVAVPLVRKRAKTPQAATVPTIVATSSTAPQPTSKPKPRSRATTPGVSSAVAPKAVRTAIKVVAKKGALKPAAPSADLDIFDVPPSDEDVSTKTPIRPRPPPSSRSKASTVTASSAPPSPAPSVESDVSNASHKRKRRASVSSSATTTTKPTIPSVPQSTASVSQRHKKYQKKEDSIAPGHEATKLQQPKQQALRKPAESAYSRSRRTQKSADQDSTKPRVTKVQSSPAKLHTMLAVRSLPKPSPPPQATEPPLADDETMYDIPEVATPLAQPLRSSLPGSVTPRQQALFSNLLGDSSDSNTSMPSISRLRLTERRPGGAAAALNRSSSDIPQSTNTRKGRLIDMLKQAAPSSDEDSESDEETEEDIAEIPAAAAPAASTKVVSQTASDGMEFDTDTATNSQVSQVVANLGSSTRITYAKQRSMLEETNFEDGLMMAMDIDDDLGFDGADRQSSVSEDGEDAESVRGIHALRRQGQQLRFEDETSGSINDISAEGGLNSSQRRSAVMEFATRMADKSYVVQLLESSLTASLLRSIAPTGEIIFDFAAAVAVLFILQTRPGYAVLDQIYQSGILKTLDKLMSSNFASFDIYRIAKDRKTNMAPSARESVAEFRSVVVESFWPTETPEKVTPQLIAMKVLETLIVGLRKAGDTGSLVDDNVVTKLLTASSLPSQRMKAGKSSAQDRLTLELVFSILEALSVSHEKQATWSSDALSRLANIMPVCFETSDAPPIRLVIRLCMNLTNNKPQACQLFASPSFVLPLLRSISDRFKLLGGAIEEDRRKEALEDLILSLGAMINLAEYSDQARASCLRNGDGLVAELVGIFLEGSARAEQADSMEESQSSVTIGYLTVLLGNLCLNHSLRAAVSHRLPGGKMDMLVQKVREFVLYNQRVDRLTNQFDGAEGAETLKTFTARLMRVVEGLESA